MNIVRVVRAGRWKKKKDRTGKKSQKGYISPIWGEAPTQVIYVKNCVLSDVLNVIIMCAKFENEGLRFYRGQIFHFPIDF